MQHIEIPMAKEGYPFILFSAFVTFILALLGLLFPCLLFLLLTGFITWFFRDPCRTVPEAPDAVICPADGKVIRIEEVDDQLYLGQRVQKISVFMNVFNVHVNRIPFSGVVEKVVFKPGKFYAADKDKAVLHNEACTLIIATDSGIRYAVVQIAGLIARRIVCRAEKGDQVQGGMRYGLIRFGSRVDIYLPLSTPVEVTVGQKVIAGETILARLKQEASS